MKMIMTTITLIVMKMETFKMNIEIIWMMLKTNLRNHLDQDFSDTNNNRSKSNLSGGKKSSDGGFGVRAGSRGTVKGPNDDNNQSMNYGANSNLN